MNIIHTKIYDAPPVNEREILRYAGAKEPSPETLELMREAAAEAADKLTYKVCWGEFDVARHGDELDFGFAKTDSADLGKNLKDCGKVVIFAATVGIGIDRLIARYGTKSPAKALMLQAIGAERIEALCNRFNEEVQADMAKLGCGTVPRFSPGYGDLPIEIQKDLFRVLDCPRKIGLTLNDSMLMSPSKSVTAFIGIKNGHGIRENSGCSECKAADCSFRRSK